jgi:histidinol phosphatase-like enzyme
MIEDILNTWPVDRARSLMIGDTDVDMETATAAGIAGVRYRGGSVLNLLKQSIQTLGAKNVDQQDSA